MRIREIIEEMFIPGIALIVVISLIASIAYSINYRIKHPMFYTIKLNFNNSVVEYKHVKFYSADKDKIWLVDKDGNRIDFCGSWIIERETTPEKE